MLFRPGQVRRSRHETAYSLTPVTGPVEPTNQPVHFLTGQQAACGVRSVWMRLNTRYPGRVTCPACLDAMNPSTHPKPSPCGSPTGVKSRSAALRSYPRKADDVHVIPPLVVSRSEQSGRVF